MPVLTKTVHNREEEIPPKTIQVRLQEKKVKLYQESKINSKYPLKQLHERLAASILSQK